MSDRFSPSWSQLKPALDEVVRLLSGDEHLLVQAFVSVADPGAKVKTLDDVRTRLHGMSMGKGIPWALFDTISALLRLLPGPTRTGIAEAFSIDTKHSYERLRPDVDGRWTVVWDLNLDSTEANQVSLFWYIPPDQSNVPVVPLPTLDYISASVGLARDNLILPALSLLLMALESALWDDLGARSISRQSDRVTYVPVEWRLKRISNRLVMTSSGGADRDLGEMSTFENTCEIRKIYGSDSRVVLQLELDAGLSGFLASDREEMRETYVDKGLSEAIQRARKAGLLDAVISQLDDTIVKLRNNLVHLPSRGVLEPPISDPAGGEFTNLEELRNNRELVNGLIPLIVGLINDVYVA
jgi:hypothetical protein